MCSALLALSGASAVIAQESQAEEIEEALVTAKPIKASQMSSIEAKRSAENLADVVSADAIGRFPDQNLADSIGRLPGMSIERDQGAPGIEISGGIIPTTILIFGR